MISIAHLQDGFINADELSLAFESEDIPVTQQDIAQVTRRGLTCRNALNSFIAAPT